MPLSLLGGGVINIFRIDNESLRVLRWINIITGIILTLVVFCFLCFTPRRHLDSVLFVTNLLFSNLLLICSLIPLELAIGSIRMGDMFIVAVSPICFLFGVMIGLIFRMCIAVERYMIIAHPTYIRGTLTSVLACVGPWVLCFLMFYVCFAMEVFLIVLLIVLLIPLTILLSIIFVVLTFVALSAATSVATEEKRRTVGVLVLLLVDCFLLIVSASILLINPFESDANVVLVLLTVSVDLTLSVLMFKGPVDKFLARLCYCMTDKNVTTNRPILENDGGRDHYGTSI